MFFSSILNLIMALGSKPMQDNWGGEEMSNWEEEGEVEIGMWNNNPSQEVNQTGSWPYKKMTPKVIIKINNNKDLI